VDKELATSAMMLAASKLPVKCKVIAREETPSKETGGESNESE
jgi:ribosomal protein L16/L10AE